MSADPQLYNDLLLQDSRSLQGKHSLKWDDVPTTVQSDIFEHLGWIRKLMNQRVCRTWKFALEEIPSTFIVDGLCDQEAPWGTRSCSFGRPNLSIEPHAVFLREAIDKCHTLVVDCSHELLPCDLYVELEERLRFTFFGRIGIETSIQDSPSLQHIIILNGRKVPWRYPGWVFQWGGGHRNYGDSQGIVRNPVKYSFINCTLIFYKELRRDRQNQEFVPVHRLFPHGCGEVTVSNCSIEGPIIATSPSTPVEYPIYAAFGLKKLLFPYSDQQFIWMRDCYNEIWNVDTRKVMMKPNDVDEQKFIDFCRDIHFAIIEVMEDESFEDYSHENWQLESPIAPVKYRPVNSNLRRHLNPSHSAQSTLRPPSAHACQPLAISTSHSTVMQ